MKTMKVKAHRLGMIGSLEFRDERKTGSLLVGRL